MTDLGANLGLVFGTSLLLGMRHALDPDHLVAVSTLVTRERTVRASARVAALWGLGHSLTLALVGGAIVVLRIALTARLSMWLELGVAAMLVLLGAANLLSIGLKPGAIATARPVAVGVVHGLAGSAGLALIVLPLIDQAWAAMLFLAVFGLGTIAGMVASTLAIAGPAMYAAGRVVSLQRGLRLAAGAGSVLFGAYLAYHLGAAFRA